MKTVIKFEIECGDTTCATAPGKFCHMIRTDMKGGGSCHLFGKVFDEDGWIQRHEDCLKVSEKEE